MALAYAVRTLDHWDHVRLTNYGEYLLPMAVEMPSIEIHHVEAAFGPPEFDPARSDMTFSIALTDYVAATLFPPLAEHIRDQALSVGINLVGEFKRA